MPTIPSNTISTVTAKPRNGATFSPDIYSPGAAIAAGAGVIGTAIDLEGKKAQDKAGKGRDRIRAIQNMNDQFNLTTRMYDQAADRRARADANAYQADASRTINAAFTGYGPNGERVPALIDTPYVRGNGDGTPEKGAYTATAEYISGFRDNDTYNGLSERARKYVDEGWDRMVSPYLQKALDKQVADVERYNVQAGANLAQSLYKAATDSFKISDLKMHLDQSKDAVNAMASMAMVGKYGSKIIENGNILEPRFSDPAMMTAWQGLREDAQLKISFDIASRNISEAIVSDDDAEAEKMFETAEFMLSQGDGEEGSDFFTPEQETKLKTMVANGRDARKRKQAAEYNQLNSDMKDLASLKILGMELSADEQRQWDEGLQRLSRADREGRINDVEKGSIAVAVGNGVNQLYNAMNATDEKGDNTPEAIESAMKRIIDAQQNGTVKAKLQEQMDKMMGRVSVPFERSMREEERARKEANKAEYSLLMRSIKTGVYRLGPVGPDGKPLTGNLPIPMATSKAQEMLNAGKIDESQFLTLIEEIRTNTHNGILRMKYTEQDKRAAEQKAKMIGKALKLDVLGMLANERIAIDDNGLFAPGKNISSGFVVDAPGLHNRTTLTEEALMVAIDLFNAISSHLSYIDEPEKFMEEYERRLNLEPAYWKLMEDRQVEVLMGMDMAIQNIRGRTALNAADKPSKETK